jgi:hypothetical protein
MIRGKMIDFDDGRVTHGLNDVLEFTARHSCEYLGLLFEKETLPQAGRGNKANGVMRALAQSIFVIYIGFLGALDPAGDPLRASYTAIASSRL